MNDANPWVVVGELAAVLERLGLRYAVGGSLASSIAGEPRSTQDADISVDLRPEHVDALIEALPDRFYLPIERLRQAAREHRSVNLIHLATAMKIDLFVAGGTPIDEDVLRRRIRFLPDSLSREVHVYTPEDVLLHELRWYRASGESSERQWRDVVGIVRVQEGALDRDYLGRGAALMGVSDLLDRVLADE